MANPIKGEVALVLGDGRAFTLLLDHNALLQAALAHSGKTKVRRLMADLQPLVDAKGKVVLDEDGDPVKDTVPATRALLFAALQAHHPEIDQREAGNILVADLERVSAALQRAAELAFPDAGPAAAPAGEGGDGANPPLPSRSGKRSGRNGARSAPTTTGSGGSPRASAR